MSLFVIKYILYRTVHLFVLTAFVNQLTVHGPNSTKLTHHLFVLTAFVNQLTVHGPNSTKLTHHFFLRINRVTGYVTVETCFILCKAESVVLLKISFRFNVSFKTVF
jgi:hypothetical protein